MSVKLNPTSSHTASLIFLHGLGDTGHGWSSIFHTIRRPNVKYIFPTAPIIPVTINGGSKMNGWFDIKGFTPDSPEDENGIKASSEILMGIVNEEIKAGIPSERIVIGGFSQGGAIALYTGITASMRFGGIIALSTWMPLNKHFPQRIGVCDKKFDMPILQCHGDSDFIVPFKWGETTVNHLKHFGFKNVMFKKYEDLGHSSDEKELIDVSEFIKQCI